MLLISNDATNCNLSCNFIFDSNIKWNYGFNISRFPLFNGDVILPNSYQPFTDANIANIYFRCAGDTNFNPSAPINLPTGHCDFGGCTNFNTPITSPEETSWLAWSRVFEGCTNFNQPVSIPNGAVFCNQMFINCTNFNELVNISNTVITCEAMFINCTSFNKPVNITDSVLACSNMFNNCRSLNSDVSLGNNVYSCYYMFSNCRSLNSHITLDNNASYCMYAFINCTNFNQSITLPTNANNCYHMFHNCRNLDISKVVIPGNLPNLSDVTGMFSDTLITSNGVDINLQGASNLKRVNSIIQTPILPLAINHECSVSINLKLPSSVNSIGGLLYIYSEGTISEPDPVINMFTHIDIPSHIDRGSGPLIVVQNGYVCGDIHIQSSTSNDSSSDLVSLTGNRYRTKRNFNKTYYLNIYSDSNVSDLFCHVWSASNGKIFTGVNNFETYFTNYDEYMNWANYYYDMYIGPYSVKGAAYFSDNHIRQYAQTLQNLSNGQVYLAYNMVYDIQLLPYS